MKLHEAIEKLLLQSGRGMSTTEIAKALNQNKWYEKKDHSSIEPYQIHGRAKNYSRLFRLNGSVVVLAGHALKNKIKTKPGKHEEIIQPLKPAPSINITRQDILSIDQALMNQKNFKSASAIDDAVPVGCCGLYCIRIQNINYLPEPFRTILRNRGHNIIYLGIATGCLNKRFLNQELRANGHGTFFRSIGAVLGFRPPKGSLLQKSNKRNYKFSKVDTGKIIQWINSKLIVNWVEYSGEFDTIETNLIEKHEPLLNLAKNPVALKELSELRSECVRIANSL